MNLTYAGIGSRKTPQNILNIMTKLATKLEQKGYTLNSGGAKGADEYFEKGVQSNKNIFIPWLGFNGIFEGIVHNPNSNIGIKATKLAIETHPRPHKLTKESLKLMARNCYQILGEDLKTPVDFVICWTPCGMEYEHQRTIYSGGTSQAISIASNLGIPVINLKNENWKLRFREAIENIQDEF